MQGNGSPVSLGAASLAGFFTDSADLKGAPLNTEIFERSPHTHITAPGGVPGGFVVAPAALVKGYDADGRRVHGAQFIIYGSYVADEVTIENWKSAGLISGIEEIIDDDAKTLNIDEADIFIVGNEAMAKADRLNELSRRAYDTASREGQFSDVVRWDKNSFNSAFETLCADQQSPTTPKP